MPRDAVEVVFITRPDVKDVYDQKIPGLCSLNAEGPTEDVDAGKRRITNVIGGVIIADGTVEPFPAVRAERVTGFHRHVGGHVRVPPVVPNMLLVREGLRIVEWEEVFWHDPSLVSVKRWRICGKCLGQAGWGDRAAATVGAGWRMLK